MRILHTSDWHLGKVFMERSLLADQRHVLTQIVELLVRAPHDLLVIAGDVFDRSIPPEEAVTLLGDWLVEVRDVAPKLPIIFIAGNHDSGARLSWSSGLLARGGVHIRGGFDRLEEPVVVTTSEGEAAQVWAIPFLWSGALGTAGQVPALEAAIGRISARQDRGVAQIAVAHCFARGGLTCESERTLIGQANLVDPALFDGFDYVALGHLHRPQLVTGSAWYSGSIGKYSFSEVGDNKGVLSVVASARAAPSVNRHALQPLREMRRIEGTMHALMESRDYTPYQDDYLSARLTEPVRAGQPMSMLRTRFPHLLQLANPAAEVLPGSVPARPRTAERHDIEADFLDFERHIREGEPPSDVIAAFQALRGAR